MADDAEARLKAMGIELPTPAAPAANYVPTVRSGNMLYVSGQIPTGPGGAEFVGKLGRDFSVEEGQRAARLSAINVLAQVRAALGSLDRVGRIVKLTGFVNAEPSFADAHKVTNGASDLMVAALGDRGRHARSAVAVASLPLGVAVEVEAIVEIA